MSVLRIRFLLYKVQYALCETMCETGQCCDLQEPSFIESVWYLATHARCGCRGWRRRILLPPRLYIRFKLISYISPDSAFSPSPCPTRTVDRPHSTQIDPTQILGYLRRTLTYGATVLTFMRALQREETSNCVQSAHSARRFLTERVLCDLRM